MINLAVVNTGRLRAYFDMCGTVKFDRGIALPRNSSEII